MPFVFVTEIRVERANQIAGRVIRADDGVAMADAVITVSSPVTNFVQTKLADASGNFIFSELPTGTYTISCTSTGFGTYRLDGLKLTANTTEFIDLPLHIEARVSGSFAFDPGGPSTDDVWALAEYRNSSSVDAWAFGGINGGRFTIDGLAAGTYDIVIGATGYDPIKVLDVAVIAGQSIDLGLVTLVASPTARVRGRVVSDNNDYPAMDTVVGVFKDGEMVTALLSESNGTFALDGLSPGAYTLRVVDVPEGIAAETLVMLDHHKVDGIQVRILTGGTIVGHVTDSVTGTSLPGVTVTLFDGEGLIRTARSDLAGMYRFHNLGVGTYFLTMPSADNHTVEGLTITALDGTIVWASDLKVSAVATLHGKLTTAEGIPVPGGVVEIFHGGFFVSSATTNEQGEYHFAIRRGGTFDLSASADGKTFSEIFDVIINPGDAIEQDFQAGDSSLTVSVYDDQTPADSAIVLLYRETVRGMALVAIGVTDVFGETEFSGLVAGTYGVDVRGVGSRGVWQQVMLSERTSETLCLDMEQRNVLRGVVTDEAANPIAGAVVTIAQTGATWLPQSVVTDRVGNYSLSQLPANEYELIVSADNYGTHVLTGLHVSGDTELDLTLTSNPGRLVVTVSDTVNRPILLAEITLWNSDGRIVGRGRTDENGVATLTAVAGSGMSIRVNANDFAAVVLPDIAVTHGETTDLGQVILHATAYAAVPPESPFVLRGDQTNTSTRDLPTEATVLQQRLERPQTLPMPTVSSVDDSTLVPGWLSYALFAYERAPWRDVPGLPAGCNHCAGLQHQALNAASLQLGPSGILNQLVEMQFDVLIGPTVLAIGTEGVTAMRHVAVADAFASAALTSVREADLIGLTSHIEDIAASIQSIREEFCDFASSVTPYEAFRAIGRANHVWEKLIYATGAVGTIAGRLAEEHMGNREKYDAATRLRSMVDRFLLTIAGEHKFFAETERLIDAILFCHGLFVEALGSYEVIVQQANVSLDYYLSCLETCSCESPEENEEGGGEMYTSWTPEDKFGPGGYDVPETVPGSEQRFIPGGQVMDYRIDFWNKPEAPVPTQDAIILDVLDPELLDLATLNLTRIGFLNWDVPLHGGQFIDTRIDCRPEMNIVVEVRAGLGMQIPGFANNDDIDENTLVWWFHTIDPDTGEWPEDPMAGFLPPFNPETGFELGWVEFTVMPREGLPSGTVLSNVAFVEFDFAGDIYDHPAPKVDPTVEPADPAPWINTIDAGIPANASRVQPLPAVTTETTFTVSWSGQDDANGSGIARYDIYYRIDDDDMLVDPDYKLWLAGTTETSAVFELGQPGRRYSFFSVATDNVGHREPWPAQADAQTLVSGNPWQHPSNPVDVDGLNGVTAQDVLILINRINGRPGDPSLPAAPEIPPPFYDVNGDGLCDARDVLIVINYLNNQVFGVPVGEAIAEWNGGVLSDDTGDDATDWGLTDAVVRFGTEYAEWPWSPRADGLVRAQSGTRTAGNYEGVVDALFSQGTGMWRRDWERIESTADAKHRTVRAGGSDGRSNCASPIDLALDGVLEELVNIEGLVGTAVKSGEREGSA